MDRTRSNLSLILASAWPCDPAAVAILLKFAICRMLLFHRLSHEWRAPAESRWASEREAEWKCRVRQIQSLPLHASVKKEQ